jgi:transposase
MARLRRRDRAACGRCAELKRENRRLEREVCKLQREKEHLERQRDRLEQQTRQLRAALEEARRAKKRQAAPFSKGDPKKKPRKPGRRSGKEHGPSSWRPAPEKIDRIVEAPLPEYCTDPDCHGDLEETEVVPQYQAEIPPVRPTIIQFNVHVGHCKKCGRRVQGRHPEQTSDALGAAGSQIGPRAVAMAAELHKGLGLPLAKVRRIFQVGFGLVISRGGICQAIARLSRKAQPTYDALVEAIRGSPVVAADETGWKVAGWLNWLWVFVTKHITVYAIQAGRGFEEAAEILGADYSGTLGRDGWAPYRGFKKAGHQSCIAHLVTRCLEILSTATGGAVRIPRAVLRLLREALALRDRRDEGKISPHGFAVAKGRLKAKLDRLLRGRPRDEENRKLLAHLGNEREALFTFLEQEGVEATNWRAEQALRPAVVTRKVCGGNRTWDGALVQEIVASVLRTANQQGHDPLDIFVSMLRSPEPIVAEVLLAANGSSAPQTK